MNKFLLSLCAVFTLFCTSCSNDDYISAIPQGTTMIIAIDPVEMSGTGHSTILKGLLHINNADQSGVDFSSKVFFFEDALGNLGLCAKTDDEDKLTDLLKGMKCNLQTRDDARFALLPNNWVVGYNAQTVLLMGPIVPAQQQEMMRLMGRYLTADEENSIKGQPIYAKLDSLKGKMTMVAQLNALPQQLTPVLSMGAPADADASDLLLAAQLTTENGVLRVQGNISSTDRKTEETLRNADRCYRPIGSKYVGTMHHDDAMGLFLNVDGREYVKLLKQNKEMTGLLAAINTAIDMDNILRGVDGNMAIITPQIDENKMQLYLAAEMPRTTWLADVPYWKESVPEGGHIGDWGKNCFYYVQGNTSYYFGVTSDHQYMSGSNSQNALASIKPADKPIQQQIQKQIVGSRMALVVNISAVGGDKAKAVTDMVKPLFGPIHTILFIQP